MTDSPASTPGAFPTITRENIPSNLVIFARLLHVIIHEG